MSTLPIFIQDVFDYSISFELVYTLECGIEGVIIKIITTEEADEEDITTAGENIITTKEGGRALSGMIIKKTRLSLFSESQVALL